MAHNQTQRDYVISVAIAEGYGHDHLQQDYLHDAILIKSTDSRLLHGILGFHELNLSINIFD
jgi:hypothetical protein